MNTQTLPTRRKPECKLAFRVERGPHWLTVAIAGEASFDQAEVIAAQLLRVPRTPRTSRQEPARFRYMLESLEGRCAPALLTVNSTDDNTTDTSAALRLALTHTDAASDGCVPAFGFSRFRIETA